MGRGWCRYLDSEEEPLKRVGNAKGECEGMIKSSWRSSLQEPRERWWQDVEDINLIRKQKEGRGEFLKKGLDTHLFKSLGFGIDWFCLRHVRLEKLGDPKRNHMDWMIRRGRLRALSLSIFGSRSPGKMVAYHNVFVFDMLAFRAKSGSSVCWVLAEQDALNETRSELGRRDNSANRQQSRTIGCELSARALRPLYIGQNPTSLEYF